MNMMDQFVVTYIPGGMTLHHSAWYLCENIYRSGVYFPYRHTCLKRSDYI
jgi:hypothetical protein